jgi:hypothetical protein
MVGFVRTGTIQWIALFSDVLFPAPVSGCYEQGLDLLCG